MSDLLKLLTESLKLSSVLYHGYFWGYRSYLHWRELRTSDKIVIYQMGKVGSTTIWRGLENIGLEAPIYHVHRMNTEVVEKELQWAKKHFLSLRQIYPEVLHAVHLRAQLEGQYPPSSWKVITLVRDPIARTLSTFFQLFENKINAGVISKNQFEGSAKDRLLEELLAKFRKKYIENPSRRHPYTWFQDELKANIGCDLFLEPDIRHRSYHICHAGQTSVLLLKLESLNDCYAAAFREFLGIDGLDLNPENVRSQKLCGDLYRDFLAEIQLPTSYLDRIYRSDLVTHFYSDAEIEQFYRRWAGSSAPAR